jgi:hypothetical protein
MGTEETQEIRKLSAENGALKPRLERLEKMMLAKEALAQR